MDSLFRVQAVGSDKPIPLDLFVEAKSESDSSVTPVTTQPQTRTSNTTDGGLFAWLQVLACFFVLMNTWYGSND
jgi:hypothetical protein